MRSLNVKTVQFPAIRFCISTQFSFIWLIHSTLSGSTTSGQSGHGSDGKEGVLRIPESSNITGTTPSDCLVPYPGHSLGGGLTPLQRCSRGILNPQPTRQLFAWFTVYQGIGLMSRVFAKGPGDRVQSQSNHTKDSKNGTWFHLC